MNEPQTNETRILELINVTKDYINDLLVCLENEDYEMLGVIDNEYAGLQEELQSLPESVTEYYPEEWDLIDQQLKDLRDVMEQRRDSLKEFLDRNEQTGAAAKAYTRNMELDDSHDIPLSLNPDAPIS
jgi:hypothetical protein